MNEWAVAGSIAVAVVTVCGTWLATKVQHKGKPENALIDQLQEEMKKMRARMDGFEARDRVYIPHIIRLNMHIDQQLGPPAPRIPKVIQDYLDQQDED